MDAVFRETKREIVFFDTGCLDYPAHIHEDVELVYVKKGTAVAYCDGMRYTLKERSFFIAFPNQVHHYVDSSNGEYSLLIVKPTSHDLLFQGRPLISACDHPDDRTVTLFELALAEYEQDGHTPVVEACLTAFFEKLFTFYTIEKGNAASSTVARILQYCNEHYREDIGIADIANALHISKSAVSHIFSGRLGISFSEHIHTLRLNDAVRLLKAGQYTVTEIAELSGFSTIRTFNRVFRDHYGMSPSAYRKSENP